MHFLCFLFLPHLKPRLHQATTNFQSIYSYTVIYMRKQNMFKNRILNGICVSSINILWHIHTLNIWSSILNNNLPRWKQKLNSVETKHFFYKYIHTLFKFKHMLGLCRDLNTSFCISYFVNVMIKIVDTPIRIIDVTIWIIDTMITKHNCMFPTGKFFRDKKVLKP